MNTHNELGWKMLRETSSSSENAFLSPSSIFVLLSLAFEGSTGSARAEGAKLLGSDGKTWGLPNLTDLGKDTSILVANTIYTNTDSKNVTSPSPEFTAKARSTYGAEIQRTSFKDPEAIAKKINTWVKEKTQGMIGELVTARNLKGIDAALLNAIYFKAPWAHEFDPDRTEDEKFDGKTPVKMMSDSKQRGYFENADFQMTEIMYRDNKAGMVVLLPKKGKSLEQIEKSLTVPKIDQAIKAMKPALVWLKLPRFEIEWGAIDMTESLKKAGMPSNGDFSPLGLKAFQIRAVLHKARVKVTESGTEAAAVTAIMGEGGAAPPKPTEFHADRPFLFLIREKATNNWIFAGRLVKP